MIKVFLISFIISCSIISCSGYTPLYKNSIKYKDFFETLAIKTDNRKSTDNIKKEMIKMFPVKKNIKFILLLETASSTSSTVNNIDGKISGYEIETEVKAKLYSREMYDRQILSFEEKANATYFLTSDQVLSTLSNRNKAIELNVKNLSKKVYNNLIVFASGVIHIDN